MTALHARATSTLVHAYETAGEANIGIYRHYLVDESGNQFVDESGNKFIALVEESAILLHAQPTNTFVHAGGL